MRFILVLALLFPTLASAWGPHPQIVEIATEALPERAALRELLGEDLARLTSTVWMADWGERHLDEDEVAYFTNDYLIRPDFGYHISHLMPEVAKTWGPFFEGAVASLVTQDSRNAARWTGSLLHFVTDSGSPPHSIGLLGPLHTPMENWLDGDALSIGDYTPRPLGSDRESALIGVENRMRGLIEFSRVRAEQLSALIEAEDRATSEPLITECAEETARVTADVLLTLGIVAKLERTGGAIWEGKIASSDAPGFEKTPARIVIHETPFSAVADADGAFDFNHLAPGSYRATISRPGSYSRTVELDLVSEKATKSEIDLKPWDRNLLRYGDFPIHWNSSDQPEGWLGVSGARSGERLTPMKGWNGEVIPVEPGETLTLSANWKAGVPTGCRVLLGWTTKMGRGGRYVDAQPDLSPGTESAVTLTVPPEIEAARVVIFSPSQPQNVLNSVGLRR